MISNVHRMASMEEGNIDGQNENKNSRLLQPEHESVEMLASRKSPLGSSYGFAREIRPKQIIVDHNLGMPPMKKPKTQPMETVQNGYPVSSIHHNPAMTTAQSPMAQHHNNIMSPSNPLSKLHELNKNITPTSFKTSSPQSSSFASIVHSSSPTPSNAPTHPKTPNHSSSPTKPSRPSNSMYQSIAPKKQPPQPFDANAMNAMNAMANRELQSGKIRQLAGVSPLKANVEAVKPNNINGNDAEQGHNDYALASLDWKDGVADLPGSKLKFKMTEFGLEIISTVETEDGQVEFSTSTTDKNLQKEAASNQQDVNNPHEQESSSTKLLDGPPDANEFCCCEICGKYGLRSEFGASGRFCGLTCVGVYTGRRNKGREAARTSSDGKVVKRKKRKGRKLTIVKQSSMNGKVQNGTADTPGQKTKGKLEYFNATVDSANPPKPFNWSEYLEKTGAQAADINCFIQENPGKELFIGPASEFKKDMKLEAIDPKHPSYFCVVTVAEVKGARLRLHFDGWSESYDFWANADSEFIFPVNWCSKNNQTLYPPRSMTASQFSWEKYLKDNNAIPAPEHLFKEPSPTTHGFKRNMKLEAIDRKNPDLICVATVTNVLGDRFLVHFDEWDDTYDYWCRSDCPYIHPVGWCNSQGRRLTPPNDDEVDTFVWSQYLRATGCKAAPPDLFKQRVPTSFKVGHKLEVVDKRNPSLIRVGTIATIDGFKLKISFDGWDKIYDDWFDADSSDLHPKGWCEKSCYPLEAPITNADKLNTVSCPTPGCRGIGHVKGAKYTTHHSQFGCPYSLQNLSKESCLVDRLAANSMAEDSDWSYERRKNSFGKQSKANQNSDGKPPSPGAAAGLGVCPTPGCNGNGHVKGIFSTHHSASGCPLNEINREKMEKMYKPILPKPTYNQKSFMKGHKSSRPNIITTRSTSKPDISYKTRSKHDQGIQVENPARARPTNGQGSSPGQQSSKNLLSFSLYNNVYNSGISPHINHGARSSERNIVLGWSCEQVAEHVQSIGCLNEAQVFIDQQIDGEAFLLLQQADIVNILKIKLGPAVKIYSSILKFL